MLREEIQQVREMAQEIAGMLDDKVTAFLLSKINQIEKRLDRIDLAKTDEKTKGKKE